MKKKEKKRRNIKKKVRRERKKVRKKLQPGDANKKYDEKKCCVRTSLEVGGHEYEHIVTISPSSRLI